MSDDRDDEETGRDRAKEIELRRAARRQRAIERLGTNNPKCVRCGESDSLVLELQGGDGAGLGTAGRLVGHFYIHNADDP